LFSLKEKVKKEKREREEILFQDFGSEEPYKQFLRQCYWQFHHPTERKKKRDEFLMKTFIVESWV